MTFRTSNLAGSRRMAARLRLRRRPLAALGGALLVISAATLAFPIVSPLVVGAAAGWLLWLAGAAMIVVSLLVGGRRSFAASVLASLVAIAGGAFLLFNPLAGAVAATLLIASVLILDGGFELALALDLRPLQAWRWVLASAVASLLAGVAVIAGAGGSRQMLAAVLGLTFATSGAALLALARRSGRSSYSAARASSAAPSSAGRSASTPST